jgi:hypothetical protein
MPPLSLSIAAAVAVFGAIYGFFSSKSKKADDQPHSGSSQPSPPSTSPPPVEHGHNRDSYYYYASPTPTPSTSAYAQHSRTTQATAGTKVSLESSGHVGHHGLTWSRQTIPTSVAHSHTSPSAQSTSSRIGTTTSTTSDTLHRASLASSHAGDSRFPPSTSTHTYASRLAQQPSARVSQTTTRTPTTIGYENSFHHPDFASPSVWESRQIPSTPTRTHAVYSTQQTYPRVGQTTFRTPTTTGYDDTLHRSDFASPSVWQSRQTPSTPTRNLAPYSTQQTSAGVRQTTVRTPTTFDYDYDDDMGPSPYSYLPPPSPDFSRVRVTRLTVPPQRHRRTQSSSSDSDYLGPSLRTRAVAHSRSLEVHDAIADAEGKKKARELRDQAKRSARDMRDARDRAKIAHRRGDREAESEYRQEARAHESAKKNLDKRAAKIFFRVNNKVRGMYTITCGIFVDRRGS